MRNRTAVGAVVVVGLVAAAGLTAFWRAVHDDLPLRLPLGPSCVVRATSASSTASAPASTAAGRGSGPAGRESGPAGQGTGPARQGTGPAVPGSGDGTPAGDNVTLDPDQTANAATIAAVGIRRGLPHRAVIVALATAMQESKLRNLAGGDRDSIGLFQQRPSQDWGEPEQLRDPRYAAGAFYSALLKVRGWQKMRVTDAAQAVQNSAHPEAYERWSDRATVLAAALAGDATGAVGCTLPDSPQLRGDDATAGLTDLLRQDWGEVRLVDPAEPLAVAVQVRDARAGWQTAHWLVAHAAERGVRRVRFAGLEWTTERTAWHSTRDKAAARGDRVLAQVFPLE